MERWSHHASLRLAKRDLKMEKIRSFSDAWKGYLKTWDRWNSQSFQGHYLTWGAYSAPYEPPVAMTNLPTHIGLWLTTIKLNPSWKNGGQQKFLDKAVMVFFFCENGYGWSCQWSSQKSFIIYHSVKKISTPFSKDNLLYGLSSLLYFPNPSPATFQGSK